MKTNIFLLGREKFEYCVHEINCYNIRMLAHVEVLFHFVYDSDFWLI